MTFFAARIQEGIMERPVIPRPTKRGIMKGSLATSPQMLTGFFALIPTEATWEMKERTAGCRGSKKDATLSLFRSTAKVYWVRSLVPMPKKSAYRIKRWAMGTAEGTSIINPKGIRESYGIFSSESSFFTLSRISRMASISSIPDIMGMRRRMFPKAEARSRAQNCVLKMWGWGGGGGG